MSEKVQILFSLLNLLSFFSLTRYVHMVLILIFFLSQVKQTFEPHGWFIVVDAMMEFNFNKENSSPNYSAGIFTHSSIVLYYTITTLNIRLTLTLESSDKYQQLMYNN